MQQIDSRPSASEATDKEEMYKQMYRVLSEYRFGHVTFLELLDTWQEILHLPPAAQTADHAQQEKL